MSRKSHDKRIRRKRKLAERARRSAIGDSRQSSPRIESGSYFDLKGKQAEKVIYELAVRSFLADWCFLNPKLPNGKELCDLLVVFDDVAIIWQIKDLKVDENGLYRESEVQKNIRQLLGARRQLFDLKTPVGLVNSRRRSEVFDPNSINEVFLISVLSGDGEAYFKFVDEIRDHTIHVFPAAFTEKVLSELDTLSDFAHYLRTKERFLKRVGSLVIQGGEEELLAIYLLNNRSFDRFKDVDFISIDDGSWDHMQLMPEYRRKKKADEISYIWDSIINRAHEGSVQYETVARELARPNRFDRRFLSKVFSEAWQFAHRDRRNDLFRRVMPSHGVTYAFLFHDDPEPRPRRKAMLGAICHTARGMYPQNTRVLGIATEKRIRPYCSYDFCFLNLEEWTDDDQALFEELRDKHGILKNPIVSQGQEDEYPTE